MVLDNRVETKAVIENLPDLGQPAGTGTYQVPLVDLPSYMRHPGFRLGAWLYGPKELRGTQKQIDSFTAWNTVGDPAADALVAYMKRPDVDSAEVRRMFDLALAEGVSAVENPPQELIDLFREVESVPYWVDLDRLDRAGKYLLSWGIDTAPVFVIGLSVSYISYQANWVLMRAGDLYKKAAPRAVETLSWLNEVMQPGALLPGGQGYQVTVRLRLTHAFIRSGVGKRADWPAGHLPMHQGLFVAPITLFSLLSVLVAMASGHVPSKNDREAVYHMWRYIAYLIGIEHSLIPADGKDLFRLSRAFLQDGTDLTPENVEEGLQLGKALIDAYGPMLGITGNGLGARAFRTLAKAYVSTIAQMTLGNEMADPLGYSRPSYWLLPPMLAYAGFNLARMRLVRLVPGGRARYEEKQRKRGARMIAKAVEASGAVTTYIRE